jgi:hypothetical protein
MDAYNGGKIMVRLEREGDSFVFITGQTKKQEISNLISAISELQKNSPDLAKIREGLLFLDNSGEIDIRKEIKSILQKALENKVVQTGL